MDPSAFQRFFLLRFRATFFTGFADGWDVAGGGRARDGGGSGAFAAALLLSVGSSDTAHARVVAVEPSKGICAVEFPSAGGEYWIGSQCS